MYLDLEVEIAKKIEEAVRHGNWAAIADLIMSENPVIHEKASDYLYASGKCSITLEQRKEVEDLY